MTNTNCLQDVACPQCGHTDSFIIEVKTRANVTDEGAETFGDMHWDERSFIECKNCGTGSIVADFTRKPMPTIAIVLDGGIVQSVYATDSNLRVIVLDLDIEGADTNDPRIYMDHAWIQEHRIESYQDMPDDDRKALESFLVDT
jgi:hypothetical protein